jgi:predicted HTH transcriptional regulator
LLANALVHQDLSITGTSVVVEIFDKRITISNPGEPIVPLDRLIDLVRSRNERLADLMRRMGICEERGSGIDKVVDAAESLLLPAPAFQAAENRTLFTIYGPRSFAEMDREDRIRACFQHCALRFEMSQRMTNQSLRNRFKLPESKIHLVSQVIANAIEEDRIKPDTKAAGTSKKFACYVPHWA